MISQREIIRQRRRFISLTQKSSQENSLATEGLASYDPTTCEDTASLFYNNLQKLEGFVLPKNTLLPSDLTGVSGFSPLVTM